MKQFFLLMAVLILTACAAPKTITVTEYRETVRTDTIELMRSDSVYVSHYLFTKGDTVYKTDTICQYRILNRTETQTEYIHDSIPYPVEVVREVRKRNGYDRFTSGGFWVLTLLILLTIAIRIARVYFKLRL